MADNENLNPNPNPPPEQEGGRGQARRGQQERGQQERGRQEREPQETAESRAASNRIRQIIRGLDAAVDARVTPERIQALLTDYQNSAVIQESINSFEELLQQGRVDDARRVIDDLRDIFTRQYNGELDFILSNVDELTNGARDQIEGRPARGRARATEGLLAEVTNTRSYNEVRNELDEAIRAIQERTRAPLAPVIATRRKIEEAERRLTRRAAEHEIVERRRMAAERAGDINTDLAQTLAEYRRDLSQKPKGEGWVKLIERFNRATTSRMLAGFGTSVLMTVPGLQGLGVVAKVMLSTAGGATGGDAAAMRIRENSALQRITRNNETPGGEATQSVDEIFRRLIAYLTEQPGNPGETERRLKEILSAYGELTRISS